jgi:hypothetical protein
VTRVELVAAVVLGLLINEATDICPWVAVRLVRWAARLLYRRAPERAAIRGEELAALVNDRPGKLLKLFTALGFALHALLAACLGRRAGISVAVARELLARQPERQERKYLYDYSHGITFESLEYYQRRRHRFKTFVEACVFSEVADAVAAGFYEVDDEQHEDDDPRIKDVLAPLLVLRDADGAELWLGGCTCGYGGEGPSGSHEVLSDAGFPREALDAVFEHSLVRLHRDSTTPIVACKSAYKDPGFGCTVKVIEGRPALLMSPRPVAAIRDLAGATHHVTMQRRLDHYRPSWLRDPQAALFYKPDFSWPRELLQWGPRLDKGRNLRIRDASGRELWIGPLTTRQALRIARRFGLRPAARLAMLRRLVPSTLAPENGRLYFFGNSCRQDDAGCT